MINPMATNKVRLSANSNGKRIHDTSCDDITSDSKSRKADDHKEKAASRHTDTAHNVWSYKIVVRVLNFLANPNYIVTDLWVPQQDSV